MLVAKIVTNKLKTQKNEKNKFFSARKKKLTNLKCEIIIIKTKNKNNEHKR